jgi:tetratricopeptide (TPR) repeat protein
MVELLDLPQQLMLSQQHLQEGRLAEAEMLLMRVLINHPEQTDAMLLLGLAFRAQKRWQEAVAQLDKACALAPQHVPYREHLALTCLFSNRGEMVDKAMDNFAAVLASPRPTLGSAANLMTLALRNDQPERVLSSLLPLLNAEGLPPSERMRLCAGLAIAAWLKGDTVLSSNFAHAALEAREDLQELPGDLPFLQLYVEFLLDLATFRHHHADLYDAMQAEGVKHSASSLHVIGESHCLTPAHTVLMTASNECWRVKPHLMMGAKAYFFTVSQGESWQYRLRRILETIPDHKPVALCFGEIDCRSDEGLMEQKRKDASYSLTAGAEALARDYLAFAATLAGNRPSPLLICGIPAPNRTVAETLDASLHGEFTGMIAAFNRALAEGAAVHGLRKVDLYSATVGESGWAREGVHLDKVHLTPAVVHAALQASLRELTPPRRLTATS